MAYNIIKGNIFAGGANPPDGYVLIWSSDGYWIARPAPSGSFIPGGDLSGGFTNQTVIGIQTRSIYNTNPTDGYVLTWSQADAYWAPRPTSSTSPSGSAGGDLSGTYPNPIVSKIQTRSVTNVAPIDGYVLTWDQADAYWVPKIATPSGPAGGDLSGTFPTPTVVKLQSRAVDNIFPSDGYVLTWDQADAYWAPRSIGITAPDATTLIKGKLKLAGDLGGTANLPSVLKINGSSVPASPLTNQVLIAVDGTTLNYAKIIDANVDNLANIAGSKIATASAGAFGVIQLAGDLGGIAAAPIVTGLQSYDINNIAPTDGYVLTWDQTDAYWVPRPTVSAALDATAFIKGIVKLTNDFGGTANLPLVTGLQSYDISSVAPTDGYVLTWDQTDAYWVPRPTTSTSVGGDISGITTNATVIKIQGNPVAVESPGALQDGYVLTWDNADAYWATRPGDAKVIQGNPVAQGLLSAAQDGYILTWYASDGYWRANQSPGISGNFGSTPISTTGALSVGPISAISLDLVLITLNGKLVMPGIPNNNTLSNVGEGVIYFDTTFNRYRVSQGGGAFTNFITDGYAAGGDLSGTYANPTVVKIRGKSLDSALSTIGASQDGYVLTWVNSDAYWEAKPSTGGGGFTAGGDLIGTSSNQTIAKIRGNPVTAQSLGLSQDGYVLTWDNADGYWKANQSPGISGNFGSTPIVTTGTLNAGSTAVTSLSTVLVTLNGKLIMPGIPTSLVLSNTGEGVIYFDSTTNTFRVSQNGSSYVNFITDGYAAGGDLSGTYASPSVVSITGSAGTVNIASTGAILNWNIAASSPKLKQSDQTAASTNGQTLTVQAQNATGTTSIGGDVVINSGTGTTRDGYVKFNVGNNLAGSFSTSKFITNSGRRVKTTITTTNLTIVDGYECIIVGAITGSIIITLPLSPTDGDIYTIKDQRGNAPTFNIIINGNGNNIDGASLYTMNILYESVTVLFADNSWGIL